MKEAQEVLVYDNLSKQEKIDYEHHVKQRGYERNAIQTALFKGEFRGEAKARKEMEGVVAEKEQTITELTKDLAQKTINTVINSHKAGIPIETIAMISELTTEDVKKIIDEFDNTNTNHII